ncbi:MAG TPA: PD-(D/E)XK nuclease family protein, partial [Polyangiaceae bacterium]|nr:PD-(D/E)XK nuclease family protein [Polyangiaceae bacterium]
FASSVLRASRDEAIGDAIGFRERGSLVHSSLAAALEAMRPLWGKASAEELERVALEAARAHLERRGQSALRRAGLAAALSDVASAVRWSLRQGADLPFYEAERGFGRGQGWAPLRVGGYFVSGRIDRIDRSVDGRRVRVIDYKTGKAPTRAELNQQLLQPFLYGLKVAHELGAEEVEAGYLPLGDRTPRLTQSISAGPGSEDVQTALSRAERSIAALASGAVEPRPSHARACLRCDGRDLCRRPLSAPLGSDDEEP